VSTTTDKPAFLQPALIGGVVMGVLSALPLVGPVGNACCCLWVISGGLVAAYVLQQNVRVPITPGDGALVGLLAGLVGAAVQTVVSIPLDFVIGPMERAMALRFIERLPPDMRDVFDQYNLSSGPASLIVFIIRHLVGFLFWLFVGAIFSTVGGVIGAALFKKNPPPPGVIDVPSTVDS
jgi:hypothetical protein